MTASVRKTDRRFLLTVAGLVLVLIVAVSFIAPSTATNDLRPSTYNTAPGGAKAAFLTLAALGRPVARWEQPLEDLPPGDAAHTTLVLAEPLYAAPEKDRLASAIHSFLQRGGRLLTTGASGALLIPGGATVPSHRFGALCSTQPEGPGPLAAAGSVEMAVAAAWSADSPADRIEGRCGADAVVVRLPVGAGEAVWWSSASPLSNAELRNDADLRLLLASLGDGRRILFDETLQQPVRSKWSAAADLPLLSLLAQAGLVFALLVFSFSRRRGPVRLPVAVPRSSPTEFARSMGDLYERAGATGVAISAAKRRLLRALMRVQIRIQIRDSGLSQTVAETPPDDIAEALATRFGGNWNALADHLRQATETADTPLRSRGALALVRALGQDVEDVEDVERLATAAAHTQNSHTRPPVEETGIQKQQAV